MSSGFIEPLESTAIYLIQRSPSSLGAYFPDRTFDPRLARRFNRLIETAYSEIRDFIVLHYRASNRTEAPFWESARNDIEIPDSPRENLELWRHVLPGAERATVPLPGEALRPQIRFSPGALAKAHIL